MCRPREPTSGLWAWLSSWARTAGSRSIGIRSLSGRPSTSFQPGSMWMAQWFRKLIFIWTRTGMVRATTAAPRRCAAIDGCICRSTISGCVESIVSTFQLSGTPAARDISTSSSTSSGSKPIRHPSTMASSAVAAVPFTAPQAVSSSSREHARDGTGRPSPSECVNDCDVDSPRAPASIAPRISADSSSRSSR